MGSHRQSRPRLRGAHEVEQLPIAVERLPGPVLGDFREQAMLDRIPWGSAGGVVSHRHGESEAMAELGLQFGLPGTATTTIAAARVGEDRQSARGAITRPLVEEASHGGGGDGDAGWWEQLGDLFGRAARPPQPRDRVAGGVVLQQEFDGLD